MAPAKVTVAEAAKLLPTELSGFRLSGAVRSTVFHPGSRGQEVVSVPTEYERHALVGADYVSADGEKFIVQLVRFERDSDAYSRLTYFAHGARLTEEGANSRLTREIGTTSFALPGRIAFFKGITYVEISDVGEPKTDSERLVAFANAFAARLEKGEGDVPILVKHLPRWEESGECSLPRGF